MHGVGETGGIITAPERMGARKVRVRRRARGFTLIELMIVVSIMAILAAVAIASFIKYLRRARESEPKEILSKVFKNLKDYYDRQHVSSAHVAFSNTFPIDGICHQANYPPLATRHGGNYVVDPDAFGDLCWTKLHFKVTENLYFDYHYATNGWGDPGDHAWSWAVADLDIDTTPAYWYVNASIQTNGNFGGGKMATKATGINAVRDQEIY